MGVVLLEHQLGVGVDLVRSIDEDLGPGVDLSRQPLLDRSQVHGRTLTGARRGEVPRPRP